MTGPGYFEHSIYLQYFKGLRNVRIVPQEKHDQGAERKYVHYPLAREIALGALSQFRGFESFEAERVLVLNNFRIKVPKDGQSKIRPWNKKILIL